MVAIVMMVMVVVVVVVMVGGDGFACPCVCIYFAPRLPNESVDMGVMNHTNTINQFHFIHAYKKFIYAYKSRITCTFIHRENIS